LTLSEPFDDAAFVSRLQKLMSMLGSEQPGEADAARRKLVEHLGARGLSLTDVAQRVRDGARPASGGGPSFTGGARELGLERQVSIARAARLEAEAEVRRLQIQVMELQTALQQAAFDVGRSLRGQGQARALAGLGWAAAAVALVMLLATLSRVPTRMILHPLTAGGRPAPMARVQEDDPADQVMRLSPGEHYGVVLVQDLPVRLNPNDDSPVRAFLNRGMRVVIDQQVHVGPANWLQIRSVTGSGWVRGGDVLH
jgi:hypothetical protein